MLIRFAASSLVVPPDWIWRRYPFVTLGVSRDLRCHDWDAMSQLGMTGGQRLAEPGIRTDTSEPASTSDQSPSNSSWASAAAGKRLSIALNCLRGGAGRVCHLVHQAWCARGVADE